jgi:hypothetical protein
LCGGDDPCEHEDAGPDKSAEANSGELPQAKHAAKLPRPADLGLDLLDGLGA